MKKLVDISINRRVTVAMFAIAITIGATAMDGACMWLAKAHGLTRSQ